MASIRRLTSFFGAHRPPAAAGLGLLLGLLGAGLAAPSGCALNSSGADIQGGPIGAACATAAECDDGNPCTADACTNGTCASANDNGFVPDDGNDCTADACVQGVATNTPQSGPCGVGGVLQCNAQGECAGCTSADQCGTSNPCQTWTCTPATICDVARMPEGSPLADPTPGDCVSMACDAIGNAKVVNDDTDLPAEDGMPCTAEVCVAGVPDHPPSAVGAPCAGNSTYCNAAGACVPCTGTFGCATGEICFNETECVSCTDGVQNGSEVSVDCGGADCPLCPDGQTCGADGDCLSGNCDEGAGICVSCMDGILNGDESDKDCGGSCPDCGTGKDCGGSGDCGSTFCFDGVCCAMDCAGACKSCDLPGKKGMCTNLPEGVDDQGPMVCNNDNTCNGSGSCVGDNNKGHFGDTCSNNGDCLNSACHESSGTCRLKDGDPCSQDQQCETGNCNSNICVP
jgi:hypothetical protein